MRGKTVNLSSTPLQIQIPDKANLKITLRLIHPTRNKLIMYHKLSATIIMKISSSRLMFEGFFSFYTSWILARVIPVVEDLSMPVSLHSDGYGGVGPWG